QKNSFELGVCFLPLLKVLLQPSPLFRWGVPSSVRSPTMPAFPSAAPRSPGTRLPSTATHLGGPKASYREETRSLRGRAAEKRLIQGLLKPCSFSAAADPHPSLRACVCGAPLPDTSQ
uniref:Uncharacterized protein n=1 Tax=Aquila chrysaetos chrysaetos TaxID=223781 RepID=A0A663E310_AQUCH